MIFDSDTPPTADIAKYYESLAAYWHPVMPSSELTVDSPRKATLLGRDIVLARLDGAVSAFRDLCRHFQARLSDGTIESFVHQDGRNCSVLRCKYHGWAYGADGDCVEIPQLNRCGIPPKAASAETYHVQERHGLIWVCLTTPVTGIPEFPECEADGMVSTRIKSGSVWTCSLPRMILSALDDYHFAWLHDGLLGTRDDAEPPARKISKLENQLISEFVVDQPANVTNAGSDLVEDVSRVDYRMIVDMPNILRLVKRSYAGTYVVFFFPAPESFNSTRLFFRVVRDYDVSSHDETRILSFEALVQSMDAPIVSNQRPWLQAPFPIKGADDVLMEYRDWCAQLSIPLTV